MKRLGRTRLHQLVDRQEGDCRNNEDRWEAFDYLSTNWKRASLAAMLERLGKRHVGDHAQDFATQLLEFPPSDLLWAFDEVRQEELDAVQGIAVSVEMTHRDAEFLRRFLRYAYERIEPDEWDAMSVSSHAIDLVLNEIDDTLKVLGPKRSNVGFGLDAERSPTGWAKNKASR